MLWQEVARRSAAAMVEYLRTTKCPAGVPHQGYVHDDAGVVAPSAAPPAPAEGGGAASSDAVPAAAAPGEEAEPQGAAS